MCVVPSLIRESNLSLQHFFQYEHMDICACMNCNCVSNTCDHPPCFLWTRFCRHYWIFIPIWLNTRKAESADPFRTSLRFSESAYFFQKFMLRSDLSVALVRTANNCQVFGILKQTKLHPQAPCDHMVITTCWSSHVFASDHVSVLTYRVVNLPSQWSNLEFVCFDDAFFPRKKKKGPFPEQIIVQ